MAATQVNVVNGTIVSVAATSGSITVPASTPGNDLIVYANFNTKTRTISSITDNGSGGANTGWVAIDTGLASSTSGSAQAWILKAANHVHSVTSITVTFSGSTTGELGYEEWSGLDTSGGIDNHGNFADTASSTSHAISLTPVASDTILFTLIGMGAAETYTLPTGHSAGSSASHAGGSFASSNKHVTPSSAQTATWGASTAGTAALIAFSLKVASGAAPATIILGEAVSTATAFGLTVIPGAHTTVLGFPSSAPTAFGPVFVPGPKTIVLGFPSSSPTAFGLDVHSVITMHLGFPSSTPAAFGPTILPGAVLVLGFPSSTPQAFGAVLRPGGVTKVLGVASSAPVARGLTLVPGARTLTLGEAVSLAQSFGLTLSQLIQPSPWSDPWNQIQVAKSTNFASPQYEVPNQIIVVSSVNSAVSNGGVNAIIKLQEA